MRNDGRRIGKYKILRLLGRGGMGEVYHARDTVLDRDVAIKRMYTCQDIDDESYERFRREARAAARLSHHGIVTVLDFLETEGDAYIVMELLRGQSLETFIEARTPISLRAKLGIVIQLCEALHYAHEREIVHRDVKPGNIWLLPNGWIKLLDFGVAKSWERTMTLTGTMVGTISYMAPELHQNRPASARSDLFAAGVVLYELVSGCRPFDGETPSAILLKVMQETPRDLRALAPDAPPAVATAVDIALQKDPAARYATAKQMASELRRAQMLLDEDDQPLVVEDRTQAPKTPSGRRRTADRDPEHAHPASAPLPDPELIERTVVRHDDRPKADHDVFRPEPTLPASASAPASAPVPMQAAVPRSHGRAWLTAAAIMLLAGAGLTGYVVSPRVRDLFARRLPAETVDALTRTTAAATATGTTTEPSAPRNDAVGTLGRQIPTVHEAPTPPIEPPPSQIKEPPVVPVSQPAPTRLARFRILNTPGRYTSCEASIGGWKGYPFDGLTYIKLAPKTYPIAIVCTGHEAVTGTIVVPRDQPNLQFRDVIDLGQ